MAWPKFASRFTKGLNSPAKANVVSMFAEIHSSCSFAESVANHAKCCSSTVRWTISSFHCSGSYPVASMAEMRSPLWAFRFLKGSLRFCMLYRTERVFMSPISMYATMLSTSVNPLSCLYCIFISGLMWWLWL